MDPALPAGWSWRRPTVGDAEAFYDLVARYNTPLIGFADFTVGDARDQLSAPGFDPDADSWLVLDADGTLQGFAGVAAYGDSDLVEAEVIAEDDRAAHWLFDAALARADAMAAGGGHDGARVDLAVHRVDERQQARAALWAFTPATMFHRMRIDHDGVPRPPDLPDGVVLRSGPADEAFQREAHGVLMESFADHFGWVQLPFEEWHELVSSSSSDDWGQLKVAYVDEAPAAMLFGHNGFVEDEGCGYVRNVGVLTEFRGRGLAKALLQQAFVDDAGRGRVGTLLHVDTNNATPALDLYLGLGMHPVLEVEVWRRPAPSALTPAR